MLQWRRFDYGQGAGEYLWLLVVRIIRHCREVTIRDTKYKINIRTTVIGLTVRERYYVYSTGIYYPSGFSYFIVGFR